MAVPAPRFANEDDAAQYWLSVLRDGTREQKISARGQLASIFERRRMFEEATELLIANVHDGVKGADVFRSLARLYRAQGQELLATQAAAEAAKYMTASRAPSASEDTVVMQAPSPLVACQHYSHMNRRSRSNCERCGHPLTISPPVYHPDPSMIEPVAVNRQVHVASQPLAASQRQETPTERSSRGGGSRIAAVILGMTGAILGLISALLALGIGGIGSAFGSKDGAFIVTLGWSALAFCFLGFLGAGLAMPKPKTAGVILLVSGIGFMISISWFSIITTPLFLLAALFAFMGRR